MHSLFISTFAYDPWRTHRIFSACRAFTSVIDPDFDAQAQYLDFQRTGWTFTLTSEEARKRLEYFYAGLTGKVEAEHPYGDPCIQGQYDAAAAL